MKFNIGQIEVGHGCRPLVIPEIGINHNGSLTVAKEMVYAAYQSGARIVKHQTHIVEDEMSSAAKSVIPGNADISIYDIMEKAALNESDEYELMKYTESLGMEFISTPFSRAAAERLEDFGVKAYKIGSGEMNNLPLIRHIARFGKPMIVSTGMNDLESIKRTVAILEEEQVPFALLHTTNLYPTKPEWVRLGAMQEMMMVFPHIPIGLSDHTLNNNACIAAMALGAVVLERHFTDSMNRVGPDIVCSMDPKDLKALLSAANEVPLMLGGKKAPIQEEQVTIDFAYATVVTIADIREGETFTKDNLWVKRPGTGAILAKDFESIIGKKAKIDISSDTHLTWDMIE
ncbi:MAG: N-acetylneuraminate synthase family protein [Veillonella sp. oral taxon 780]|jgi:SAF domain protein|uniref:N-acetylneuraminate synthase family protein n=1 Tax=Veillonella sp. CNR 79/14 TaxID=2490954 RepID=UPI000F8F3661|nr:N-acetylneuraminate synthase family protein [Veillonella sp. CNR 79/14]MBS6626075.1 N-acetylneuraminate synthase family protein [Veillonella sp. oral taxon 780]